MISCKKHLRPRITKVFILFVIVTFSSCQKESEEVVYVAKVNNSFLTREEFASLVDTSTASELKKNDVIRDWIHREVLFQRAEREGILNDKKFNQILSQSVRELAGAMLIEKLLSEDNYSPDSKDLKSYFDVNKNEFRVVADAFIINLADFLDEEKAIRFRNIAVESDWKKALSQFSNDPAIVNQISNKLFLSYQINPASLARIVKELYPKEISIVISTKPGYYSVAQLIEKIETGSTPAFENIQDEVVSRVKAIRRQTLVDEYLKQLYSKSNIEIKIQDKNEN
ncbi:MAG: peptidyl-prolyl cis-trans isomerase [Ignavibacterium sp.]|nr:peptidyl-prolyl cis-trans isomerase [Ignavibacterium sp.]